VVLEALIGRGESIVGIFSPPDRILYAIDLFFIYRKFQHLKKIESLGRNRFEETGLL
jgi:hypothetical protein